jgi:hypothetical protein
MLKCTSELGTDFRATTDITLMGTIIRTALTPTISLIIGTVATVTTTITTIIIITTTIKLR